MDVATVRRVSAGAVLLTVALTLACGDAGPERGNGDEPDRPEEAVGGTAVLGGVSDPSSVNALVSTGRIAEQFQQHLLFLTLVRHGPDLRPRPYLARSWEISPDSAEVTFRLRRDVTWHDGEPTTAEDVAFTFRRAKDPEVPFPNRSYFRNWKSVEVVDRYTVRFEVEPTYGLLLGWAQTPIMPEHVLGEVAPSDLRSHPFGSRSPVGNGPFRFVEHRPQERWVFEANPDFPEDLGGKPPLDRLVYRVVSDPTALMAEFRTGGVHVYMNMPPERAREAGRHPELRVERLRVPGYVFVAWNGRRPTFSDARVRRALTLAIDRASLVQAVAAGYGTPASGPIGPSHWAYDSAWAQLPHAPDSARALLAEAGWRDLDGDGVREREGREFRFELLVSGSRERRDLAVLIQADLAEVGVEATPRVTEFSALASRLTGADRDYDAAILSWIRDPVVDDRDLWSCADEEGPYQFAGYCDPEADAVLDSLSRSSDRDARRELLERYREILLRDQPYTFLYHQEELAGVRRELGGATMDWRGELTSAARWWLEPASGS